MSSDSTKEFEFYVATTSRLDRYRSARKTLRLFVYEWMEHYVALSFVASLALPWLGDGLLKGIILANVWLVGLVGVAHYASLSLRKPWLVIGAATEATLL